MSNTNNATKQIGLEKNKEFTFKIPVLINASDCQFKLDLTYSDLHKETTVVFKLRFTKGDSDNEKNQFVINITNSSTLVLLRDYNLEGEFLLLGCISNKAISFSLSIYNNVINFNTLKTQ